MSDWEKNRKTAYEKKFFKNNNIEIIRRETFMFAIAEVEMTEQQQKIKLSKE